MNLKSCTWTGSRAARLSGAGALLLVGLAGLIGPMAHADPVTTPNAPVTASVQLPGTATDTCTTFTNRKQPAEVDEVSPDPLNPQVQWVFHADIYVSRTCPNDAVITKIVPYATSVLTPDWLYYGTLNSVADASTAEATGDFGYYPPFAPPPPGSPSTIGLDQGCQNINVIIEPRANDCRAHLYPQILWSIDKNGTGSYVTQWG